MMKNQVNRLKSPLRSFAPFFLLTVLSLLPPDGVHDRAHATEQQPGAAAGEAAALTLADVIALALRDNRGPICSACGVQGQRLSPAAARSQFEWKLFPQATAAGTDETRRVCGGMMVQTT
jgi:hypothetical protein